MQLSRAERTALMTGLSRQELDDLEGELIEDRSEALWSYDLIDACRVAQAPPLTRIVVALDPPGVARAGSCACGIVAAGRAEDGVIHVLHDASVARLAPSGWAGRAVRLVHRLQAHTLVAEVNMGGDMVGAVLRAVDPAVPLKEVRARRGKFLRAAPVAALYRQGRVKHVGSFAALEDEMCDFGPDGLSSGRSPDRLDALVWAVSELAMP